MPMWGTGSSSGSARLLWPVHSRDAIGLRGDSDTLERARQVLQLEWNHLHEPRSTVTAHLPPLNPESSMIPPLPAPACPGPSVFFRARTEAVRTERRRWWPACGLWIALAVCSHELSAQAPRVAAA